MGDKKNKINKGVVISGGKVKIENLAIGKNAKVNVERKLKEKERNDSERKPIDTQNLKNLIEENRIIHCLDILKNATKNGPLNTYFNEVIIYISKAKNLKKEENMVLAARENIQINRSQLIKGILELIDEIEKEISK